MEIREIMCRDVESCRADDTLEVAARRMWEHDCGALPVLDGNRPIAMVTDRDIAMGAYLQGQPLAMLRVSSVMSKSVVTCAPTTSIVDAEASMQKQQVRRLPVVDANGAIVGIVSLADIARATANTARRKIDGPLKDELVETFQAITKRRNGHAAERPLP